MDGNGRWALKNGKQRIFGHRNAMTSVRETVQVCTEIGVKYLTLYAFSTENWERPKYEVNALMELLVSALNKEIDELNNNDIKLTAIGDLNNLPPECKNELERAKEKTNNNKKMTLILAISYSSRWEIVSALKNLCYKVKNDKINPDEITAEIVEKHLTTAGIPDPDLLIRTSGEYRISNFLLWQLAYSELYFTDVLWPDIRKKHIVEAIQDYQKRERRFGKTTKQINQ